MTKIQFGNLLGRGFPVERYCTFYCMARRVHTESSASAEDGTCKTLLFSNLREGFTVITQAEETIQQQKVKITQKEER
jgi:hypothetical protein